MIPSRIRLWLAKTNGLYFSIFAISAAFITYLCMYGFRKPFTVGTYEDLSLWGMDYKIVLIITQVAGYMLSKFAGIKVVSEMTPQRRAISILLLIGLAELALLLFALIPYPYNFVALFFNGLPLGMIWGIVFSFLEGRRFTEMLGAGMCTSFIVGSGVVKSVGKVLMDSYGVSEFWMPFATGLVFALPLLFSVWLLTLLPPPSAEDEAKRTPRVPMSGKDRWRFFQLFAPGIVLLVVIYIFLTAYRDFRDNFAIELWTALGYGDTPEILTLSELPIAIAVLLAVGLMMYVRDNLTAFMTNHYIIVGGGLLVGITTLMVDNQLLDPALWMILVGLGMYLCYITYHTLLFERLIAVFKQKSNIGFLMYIADAFGYLGSVGVLVYKNFGAGDVSWLNFFRYASYLMAGAAIFFGIGAYLYFRWKVKQAPSSPPPPFHSPLEMG